MIDLMKMQARDYSVMTRHLKADRRKAGRTLSGTAVGSNYRNRMDMLQDLITLERMVRGMKHNSRHLHLARAFIKGTPYKVVEQDVREGNAPDLRSIISVLDMFDEFFYEEHVREWLYAA